MDLNEMARRIRRGDKEALKSLVDTYGGEIYRKALDKCGDPELAREATRQTFRQIVKGIQTQEDEHGWKLWIDMLAKTNITTYSMVATDISIMETELERELFPTEDRKALPEQSATPPRVLNTVSAQVPVQASAVTWRDVQVRTQTVQPPVQPVVSSVEARPVSYEQPGCAQSGCAQPVYEQSAYEQPAYEQPVYEQSAYEQPVYEQPADEQSAYEQPDCAQSGFYPPQPDQSDSDEQPAPLPPLTTRGASSRRKKKRRPVEEPMREKEPVPRRASAGRVVSIFLLALLCVLLVWVVLGVAMSMSLLPKWELGYTWFNQHLFKMF